MLRSCTAALVLWISLIAAYALVFFGTLPFPVAMLLGSVVWIGLVMLHGAQTAWTEWAVGNRMARGERPRDGELAYVAGEIRPHLGELLQAPFTGRACVLYSYDVGSRSGDISSRDYTGFGMTRCAIHTRYGAFALGSFPILEEMLPVAADRERAAAYIAATRFEPFSGIRPMLRATIALHTRKPPLQVDWQIGEPPSDVHALAAAEVAVEPGTVVTAIGRYEAGTNAIVGDAKQKGFLRLRLGGAPRTVAPFPRQVIGRLLGALFFVVVPNVALWWYLTRLR